MFLPSSARLRERLIPTLAPPRPADPLVPAFHANPSVQECRRQAQLLGFEAAGLACHTYPSGGRSVSEVWASGRHPTVTLTIFDIFYAFTTRWSGDQALLTFSSLTPQTRPHRKLVVQGGSGAGLAADLTRHLHATRTVAPEESHVLEFEGLEREGERELRHYRRAMPLGDLVRYFGDAGPLGWLRACAGAVSSLSLALLCGLVARLALLGIGVSGVALLFLFLAAFSGPDEAQQRMARLGLSARELSQRDFADALRAGTRSDP